MKVKSTTVRIAESSKSALEENEKARKGYEEEMRDWDGTLADGLEEY